MTRMQGKTAVITGTNGGIGAATARRFAREGARVVLADIDEPGAARVAESIRAAGGEAIAHPLDLADEGSIARLIAGTLAAYGKLDVVFNNAADTSAPTMSRDGPIEFMDAELWDSVFRVNTRGAMLMIKHALPSLLASGNASIINTSSGAAMRGDFFRSAYAASKAALHSLTRSVAAQYGKRGVRCNVVSPGMVVTEHAEKAQGSNFAMYTKHLLVPALGRPEDIAAMVTLLASDDGRFVNGQVIGVDGGNMSHMPHLADSEGLVADWEARERG